MSFAVRVISFELLALKLNGEHFASIFYYLHKYQNIFILLYNRTWFTLCIYLILCKIPNLVAIGIIILFNSTVS